MMKNSNRNYNVFIRGWEGRCLLNGKVSRSLVPTSVTAGPPSSVLLLGFLWYFTEMKTSQPKILE